MPKIALINNNSYYSGLGKYAYSLFKFSKRKDLDHVFFNYKDGVIEILNAKESIISSVIAKFVRNKLVQTWLLAKPLPGYKIYHLANQNLSFLPLQPKIITCHDLIGIKYPSNLIELGIRKFLYSGLKGAEVIIADSKSTKNDLVREMSVPKSKIKVVPLGIDHTIFKKIKLFRKPAKGQIVLYVGSDERRKNVQGIINALIGLKIQSKLTFVRIGEPGRGIISRLTRIKNTIQLRLKGIKYRWISDASDDELCLWYNRATVFVFPSFYEGFGLPVLEAMACGCPVITSNNSSLTEICGSATCFVDPNDPKDIAKKIERVLSDPEMRNRLSAAGMKQAKKFSWDKTARATDKIYQSIIR